MTDAERLRNEREGSFESSQTQGRWRRLRQKGPKGEELFVFERPKVDYEKLLGRIAFRPFPVDALIGEGISPIRQLLAKLNRDLKPRDLSLLFSRLPDSSVQELMDEVSPLMAEEIMHHQKRLEERPPEDGEIELALAKFSLSAVRAAKDLEDPSPLFERTLREYLQALSREFTSYCKELLDKSQIPEHLNSLSPSGWTKLAGFTPRDQMAMLQVVLSPEDFRRLREPLPQKQKEELREQVTVQERREDTIEFYGDLIDIIQRFRKTLDKVLDQEVEG